jgi:hypothetical protein
MLVYLPRSVRKCIVRDDPTSITFTPFPFLSPPYHYVGFPPTQANASFSLLSLASNIEECSEYLEDLAARIDAPRLGNIDITFFNEPT